MGGRFSFPMLDPRTPPSDVQQLENSRSRRVNEKSEKPIDYDSLRKMGEQLKRVQDRQNQISKSVTFFPSKKA